MFDNLQLISEAIGGIYNKTITSNYATTGNVIGSQSFGFATAGNIVGSTGEVRSDGSYSKRSESFWDRRCFDIELNPCEYDIDGFKNCISSELGSNYLYIAGIRDCAWWVGEVVSLCKKGNKR